MKLTFLLLLCTTMVSALTKPMVATSFGPIVGFQHKANDRTYNVFLGIRYAKAPDHIFRFQKPEPVEKWDFLQHDATHFRASCIPSLRSELEEHVNYSEDCLFLNIITPEDYKGKKLPVVVYIHGGGFQFGDSVDIGYEKAAENFVANDIIFVSVQYRLGPLGFFTTGDSEVPGNFGLWDQTMALNFLHEVLADFGGDAQRITLAGHSAGAGSVSAHLYSPHSDHLFNQAIQLSGSIFSEAYIHSDVVEGFRTSFGSFEIVSDSKALAKAVGCLHETSKRIRECMEIQTIDQILDAMEEIGEVLPGPRNIKFHPHVDTDFFPYNLEKMSRKAPKKRTLQGLVNLEFGQSVLSQNHLTKLLGIAEDKWASFGKEEVVKFIKEQVASESDFGSTSGIFQQIVQDFYLPDWQNANSSVYLYAYAQLLSDLKFNIPTLHEIELKVKHGWETFFYVIDYQRAFHASELRFLFEKDVKESVAYDERDKLFATNFVSALVNFIKTGNPSTPAVPWPAATPVAPFKNLLLNDHPVVQENYRDNAYVLWKQSVAGVVGSELLKRRLPAADAARIHTEL